MRIGLTPEVELALEFFLIAFPVSVMFVAVSLGAVAKSIENLTKEEEREHG